MGGYYASIAKSLERIADTLEKMTAPSVDGRELYKEIKIAFEKEALRREREYAAAFQDGQGSSDAGLCGFGGHADK